MLQYEVIGGVLQESGRYAVTFPAFPSWGAAWESNHPGSLWKTHQTVLPTQNELGIYSLFLSSDLYALCPH